MAEKIETDDISWAEVRVALIFTAATSAVFLGIFEIARRNPSLSVVFDRRRFSKPHRTPPPLIRHSIFEWLFLSNEPRYSEYSDLSHMRDVVLERKRQRKHLESDKKSFFTSLRAGMDGGGGGRTSTRAGIADDHDSPKHKHSVDRRDSFGGSMDNSMMAIGSISVLDNIYGVETQVSSGRGSNGTSPSKGSKIQKHLTPDVVEISGRRLPKEVAEYALANDLSEDQLNQYEEALIYQEEQDELEFHRRVKGMRLRYEKPRGSLFSSLNQRRSSIRIPDSDDEEGQNVGGNGADGEGVFHFNESKIELPERPNRVLYVNFQQGVLIAKPSNPTSPRARTLSPRSLFSRMWSTRSRFVSAKFGDESAAANSSPRSAAAAAHQHGHAHQEEDIYFNRHLKTEHMNKRPLSQSDTELLRCIGLDTFVMIRFLRFCFDVTFYPFLFAMMILIPTYYTNTLTIQTSQVEGYFRYTINRLEDSSAKVWVAFGYTVLFVLFILRRHWIEWETFIRLHFDFMANGDVENEEVKEVEGGSFKSRKLAKPKDDVQLHLQQFRNSCMIEFVPDSHRRDTELFQFFNSVFPDQVKRAEIIINANKLAELVKQRQSYIEQYESVYAKFQHHKQLYWRKTEGLLVETCSLRYCMSCKCLEPGPTRPDDPTMSMGKSRIVCCGRKKVKALPYLLSEIKRLNREVDKEHRRITQSKNLAEDREERRDITMGAKNFLTGTSQELTCSTGFVEFTTLTAKQSALQCNLTGTNDYMVTQSAPDPRDMLWANATVERKFIHIKRLQCDALLFTGTLFWSIVVGAITVISDLDIIKDRLPPALIPKDGSFLYDLVEGYLPVVLLEILMLPVPWLLKIIATKFIRFKTHSEIDQFVYKWHFAYRVANLIIIVVRHQVLKTFNDLLTSPQSTIYELTGSIATSSQFFLNNMIIAAGTETLFELSQLHRIVGHFFLHQFITVEAASRRRLEKLYAPVSLEWGDVVPKFIFALLVAAVYSAIVPVVTGACAGFFYIATKVYTHQAMFIYAQPYEGGGTLMYQLNRSVFSTVYTTVTIFAVLLGLKRLNAAAVAFFFVMNIITILVDRQIRKKFIKPGLTLALTNARIIDEQNKLNEKRERQYQEYKRAKLKRQKQASRAAKDLHMKTYKEITSKLLPPLPPGDDDSPPKVKRTRFAEVDVHEKPAPRRRQRVVEDDFTDDEGEDYEEEMDFFLYRQPELNKILWETKPRPYLSSSNLSH